MAPRTRSISIQETPESVRKQPASAPASNAVNRRKRTRSHIEQEQDKAHTNNLAAIDEEDDVDNQGAERAEPATRLTGPRKYKAKANLDVKKAFKATQRKASGAAPDAEQIQIELSAAAQRSPQKRRRLIDKQENAQKLSFDEEEANSPSQRSSEEIQDTQHQDIRSSPQLQPNSTGLTSVSNDRGFRNGEQAEKAVKRGRPKAVPRADDEFDVPEDTDDDDAQNEQARLEKEAQLRKLEAPSAASYASTNQAAKSTKAGLRTEPNKVPQLRKRWEDVEIEALLEYIAMYGASWAFIKKMDDENADAGVLSSRVQLDLRDKARNIKMDYLTTGRALPPNFDKVMLPANLIGKLAAMNIRYKQNQVRKRKEGAGAD